MDLAVGSSLATKTFTGSYGKLGYGAEGLSMAGPLLLDAEGMAPRRQRWVFWRWVIGDYWNGASILQQVVYQRSAPEVSGVATTGDLDQSKEPQIFAAFLKPEDSLRFPKA